MNKIRRVAHFLLLNGGSLNGTRLRSQGSCTDRFRPANCRYEFMRSKDIFIKPIQSASDINPASFFSFSQDLCLSGTQTPAKDDHRA